MAKTCENVPLPLPGWVTPTDQETLPRLSASAVDETTESTTAPDDLANEWPDEQPTEIDLLPDDLAEIEREEPTPVVPPPPVTLDYERGRRAGVTEERDRVLAAVGAILSTSHNVSAHQVAQFLDLVRQKLDHPGAR